MNIIVLQGSRWNIEHSETNFCFVFIFHPSQEEGHASMLISFYPMTALIHPKHKQCLDIGN